MASQRMDSKRLPFSEPGVPPHYAPSWTFRIAHYHLTLDLFPSEARWQGRAQIRIEPLASWTGAARFDLEEVQIDAVTDTEGQPLAFTQRESSLTVQMGDARTVVCHFRGERPRVGLYAVGPEEAHPDRPWSMWSQCQDEDAHFIFPCLDHPRIRHPWTVVLSGPAHHTLVSNGVCTHEVVADGRRTTTWEVADAVPPYLFTAISAELDVHEAQGGPVPVRYLVPQGTPADQVTRSMGRTPEMIAAYADFLHTPYAWPRYDQTVVHDFVFGGMENTGATTMTELLLVDERVGAHWPAEDLVSHELAHQWFGDLVTCQDWSQGWLNESFATFMETVWRDAGHGAIEGTWHAFEQFRAYLEEDRSRYRRAIESYRFREPIDMFDRHLYEKGAVILRMLRAHLGPDAFRASLAAYLAQNAHQPVHARDLQRAFEETTGTNLDGFFTDFIRSPGHPILTVALELAPKRLKICVNQTQEGEGVPEAYTLHLPVAWEDAGGASHATVLDLTERAHTFLIPVDQEIKNVFIDPDFQVFAQISLKMDTAQLADLVLSAPPILAIRALTALQDKGTPVARKAVALSLQQHAYWGVRAEAAGILAAMGTGDDDVGILVESLAHDTDTRVRSAAALALGARRTDRAFASLRDELAGEIPTWHLTADLLEALGATRHADALPILRAWADRPSWGGTITRGVANGLARSQRAEALPDLLAILAQPHDDRTRGLVLKALSVLGEAVPEVRRPIREQLERFAQEGRFRSALAALDGLGRLGDTDAIGVLSQQHASAGDGRLRRAAFESLTRLQRAAQTPQSVVLLRNQVDALTDQTRKMAEQIETLSKQLTESTR